jgi:hypothetical protein
VGQDSGNNSAIGRMGCGVENIFFNAVRVAMLRSREYCILLSLWDDIYYTHTARSHVFLLPDSRDAYAPSRAVTNKTV